MLFINQFVFGQSYCLIFITIQIKVVVECFHFIIYNNGINYDENIVTMVTVLDELVLSKNENVVRKEFYYFLVFYIFISMYL